MPPENLFEFMRDIENNIAFKKYDVGSGYPDSYSFERILKDIDKFQYGTESTQAVSTGVAHDEINSLIHKKKETEPSLLNFIRDAVATVEGVSPEETPYGRAIAQIVEESGSPHLSSNKGFWTWPSFRRDRRYNPSMGKKFPENYPVDTIRVSRGDVDDLLSELSHAKQFQFNLMDLPPTKTEPTITDSLLKELKRQLKWIKGGGELGEFGQKTYHMPGTVEYEAHEEIEPLTRKRFKTLLDSLSTISAPVSVESLFQNQ